MVFEQRSTDEDQNQNDDKPLFRLGENKQIEQSSHHGA